MYRIGARNRPWQEKAGFPLTVDIRDRVFATDEPPVFLQLTFEDRVQASSLLLVSLDTVWDLLGRVAAEREGERAKRDDAREMFSVLVCLEAWLY